jgi:hypothetical protein
MNGSEIGKLHISKTLIIVQWINMSTKILIAIQTEFMTK